MDLNNRKMTIIRPPRGNKDNDIDLLEKYGLTKNVQGFMVRHSLTAVQGFMVRHSLTAVKQF